MAESIRDRVLDGWAPIGARWERTWRDVLGELPLPHKLPAVMKKRSSQFPHQPYVAAAFTPLGFGGGVKSLRRIKRTTNHNRIVVDFDVGTWSHAASCSFTTDWKAWAKLKLKPARSTEIAEFLASLKFSGTLKLPIRFTPKQSLTENGSYGCYPIGSPEIWVKMMQNAAVVVAYLEQKYLPEIERMLASVVAI